MKKYAEPCSQHYLYSESERHINVRPRKRVSLTELRRKRVHDNKNKILKLKTNLIVVISWVHYMIFLRYKFKKLIKGP